MDEPKPKQFANQIIQQMVQHMVSGDMALASRDYMSIRMVFKQLGGSWREFAGGNLEHMELLKNVILSWGQTRSEEAPV
jgi:hypothetical protein